MDRLPNLPKLLIPLLALLLAASIVAAGEIGPAVGLAARLQEKETAGCWELLMELQSCSGEVVLFFLNGETYLGPSCCRAIRAIEKNCWAAEIIIVSLGFTAEEGDVLRGYCDAAAETPSASLSSASDKDEALGHN
ncbi:Egg cell-secreted protein 1.1 [Platanthera guangdongensis]|uniref:Egg cell-secreted protein 1.1 n=1 Tax=Platanthera guangdongensis TaxID=2320717 RepID=A0ABR2LF46_9ASPA